MDDPAAPEQPAPVVGDAGGEGDRDLAIIKSGVDVPPCIEPYKPLELFERLIDLFLDRILVVERHAGKRCVEVHDHAGADHIDNGTFTHLVNSDRHSPHRFFLELGLRERLEALGVTLSKTLLRCNRDRTG